MIYIVFGIHFNKAAFQKRKTSHYESLCNRPASINCQIKPRRWSVGHEAVGSVPAPSERLVLLVPGAPPLS